MKSLLFLCGVVVGSIYGALGSHANNISLTYNDTCDVNDTELSNYECYGFTCGIAACSSDASSPVRPKDFDIGVDVAKWCQYEWYDCSNVTYYDINDPIVSKTLRTRKKISSYSADEELALQIALSCSNSMTDGGNKENYELNSIKYILTFHGFPGWFVGENEDLCSGTRQKNAAGTCCIHHVPSFWTWHRLYMTQIENSLRQWNPDISLPYWSWVDYPDENQLPSIFLSPYFMVDSIKYRNPLHIFEVGPSGWTYYAENNPTVVSEGQAQYCNYTKQSPSDGLFFITTPNKPNSLFQQIYYSMFYKSYVAMDLAGEVPHDNVHDFLFGNMANLRISSLTPVFMFHHGAVEKYFLLWQILMKETFGIDYTESKWQHHYFGCFLSYFSLDTWLAPFTTSHDTSIEMNEYNVDPITNSLAGTTLKSMDYESQYYTYDNFSIGYLTYEEIQKDLCHYFKDIASPGCTQFASDNEFVLFDEEGGYVSSYNATMFLGFYIPFDHYGMQITFSIYRYNEKYDDNNDEVLLYNNSFYIVSGGYDSWNDAGSRFLYKYDVTEAMNNNFEHFQNGTYFVDYNVFVQENDYDGSSSSSNINDTHSYYSNSYIDYPLLIYRNGAFHDSEEVYQIYIGDNHNYYDNSVIFNHGTSLIERNNNTIVEIIDVYEIDSCSTFNTEYTSLNDISISNDLYFNVSSVVISDFIFSAESYLCTNTSDNNIYIGSRSAQITYDYIATGSSASEYKFSYTSENTIYVGDIPIHRHYNDHYSFQRFDGSIFTDDSGTSFQTLLNQLDDILEAGQLFIPWNDKFLANDSSLYGKTHDLTGFTANDEIQLINCGEGSDCELPLAYVVYTEDDYNNCNNASSARRNKGSFSAFGCTNGWNFQNDTTYYFISSDPDSCENGLKLAIHFGVTTDCSTTNTPLTCNLPENTIAHGTVPGTDNMVNNMALDWNLTVTDGDCGSFDFTIQVPDENGWFAYSFFGPWTMDQSEYQMNGLAIVVFECDCPGGESTYIQLWQLIKEGVHTLITDLAGNNQCVEHEMNKVDGITTITCTGITTDAQGVAPYFLNSYNISAREGNDTQYYFLYAEQTQGCDAIFNNKHDESVPPIIMFDIDFVTDSMIGNTNDTNDTIATTMTSGDSDEMDDDDGAVYVRVGYKLCGLFSLVIVFANVLDIQ